MKAKSTSRSLLIIVLSQGAQLSFVAQAMVKKALERVLVTSVLLLILLTSAAESSAGGVVNVHIYMEQGSVWNSPQGQQIIKQSMVQALVIWKTAGVKLNVLPGIKPLNGNPDQLTGDDINNYASSLKASARNIVVVFTNKSMSVSRAWTEDSLVKANTPVIIVGQKVFDKPGTNRDLAHELGHVILRDPTHKDNFSRDTDNIMFFGTENLGDILYDDQRKKALEYPCSPDVTNCPEITMAPGAGSRVVIKEVNLVASQSSPNNMESLPPQMVSAWMKPSYWPQLFLASLGGSALSSAQWGRVFTFTEFEVERAYGYTVREASGQDDRLDKPFGQPMYVVHVTETSTTSGPVKKDAYWLHPRQPVNGSIDTADGSGGTFYHKAELVGGPFQTLRAACQGVQGNAKASSDLGCPQAAPGPGATIKVVRSCTGNEIEAKPGTMLCEGDKCRTNFNSRAILNFLGPNQSVFTTVTISQASEVEVGGFDAGNVSGALLALGSGEVQSQVNNIAGLPVQFTVISPAVAVSARGTNFTVRHDRQRQVSTISVREGMVEVTPTDPGLQAFTLQAGQQREVAQGNVQPGTITGPPRGPGIPPSGVPPAGPVSPGTPPSSGGIGGTWSTTTGDTITLTQMGSSVTGTYRGVMGTGTLSGTFDGRTLTGTIEVGQQGFVVKDTFTLRLTPDGRLEGRVGSILSVEVILTRR